MSSVVDRNKDRGLCLFVCLLSSRNMHSLLSLHRGRFEQDPLPGSRSPVASWKARNETAWKANFGLDANSTACQIQTPSLPSPGARRRARAPISRKPTIDRCAMQQHEPTTRVGRAQCECGIHPSGYSRSPDLLIKGKEELVQPHAC